MRRSGTVVSGKKGNFSATFSAKLHLQQRNKRQNGAIETFLLHFLGGDRFLGLFNHRRTHTQAIIHEKRFELDSVRERESGLVSSWITASISGRTRVDPVRINQRGHFSFFLFGLVCFITSALFAHTHTCLYVSFRCGCLLSPAKEEEAFTAFAII